MNLSICMSFGLRRAGRPLPSLTNPAKALLSGGIAAVAMTLLMRVELPWLLTLVAGGAVYLAGLALTRAIPRQLILSSSYLVAPGRFEFSAISRLMKAEAYGRES